MAYSFGGGINPQLGAIDYSPILRGAQQYAQSTAAGSAAIGQGIGSALSSLGQGIQGYQEQKKQMKAKEGQIKSTNSFFEAVQKIDGIPQSVKEQALAMSSRLNDSKLSVEERFAMSQGAVGELTSLLQLGEQAKQNRIAAEAAQLSGMMDTRGQIPSMVRPGAFSPEAVQIARQRSQQNRYVESQIAENLAQAEAARMPKAGEKLTDKDVLYRDMTAAFVARNGRPPSAQEQAEISSQVYGAKEATRMFRSPEEEAAVVEAKAEAEDAVKFLGQVADTARLADENSVKYNEISRLLDEGAQAGWGQDYLTELRSIGSRLGFKDDDLASQQKMEALMAEDALMESRRLLSGQGSVTESERARVDKVALDARKNKDSLRELIGIRNGLALRQKSLEIERLRLEDAGITPRQIKKELRKWLAANPASAFMPAVGPRAGINLETVRKANSIIAR